MSEKTSSLAILIACEVLAMALWFSASATLPDLRQAYAFTDFHASLFTSMVSIGFVCGTLISAFLGLADRLAPRQFFMIAALVGAGANGAILLVEPTDTIVLFFRFLTGLVMAGVYPVGMKMAASWAQKDMGLLIGLLVGALTLGSALPHLFNTLGGLDWRVTIATASLTTLVAAILINFVKLGPLYAKAPAFHPSYILDVWKNRALRYANFGYFGHMWELYAMWGWIGVFMVASLKAANVENAGTYGSAATFLVIGGGAIGCLGGGWLADRIGRTALTMWAMAISGTCALVIGFFFGGSPVLLMIIALIWGISVIADSAQFSSCVMEVAPKDKIGSMVTMQTCIGFSLTLISIHAVPYWVDGLGWHWAFAPLAIGPFLGVLAMWKLRGEPDAVKIAHGKK